MKPNVFIFIGEPTPWKYHAISTLKRVLNWLGEEVKVISPIYNGDSVDLSGFDGYITSVPKVPNIDCISIVDAYLPKPTDRSALNAKIRGSGGHPVFVEYNVDKQRLRDPIDLLLIEGGKERAEEVFKKHSHLFLIFSGMSSKDDNFDKIIINVGSSGGRTVSTIGLESHLLNQLGRLLTALEPIHQEVIFCKEGDLLNGEIPDSIPLASTYIFSSTESWARDAAVRAKFTLPRPKTHHEHDTGCYLVSCLDDRTPLLDLTGLTREEIQSSYVENNEMGRSYMRQEFSNDWMSEDEVTRVMVIAHEESNIPFRRFENTLGAHGYLPLVIDLMGREDQKLILCGDHAHDVLSKLF